MRHSTHTTELVTAVIQLLRQSYPKSKTSLDFCNPFELLVATILSAQTTDKKVNQITPPLFKLYPDAFTLAKANKDDLVEIIRPLGLYNNKATSLLKMASSLVERFHGEVPRSLQELTKLGGVGRKTATAVLGNAFGITAGITVDTHVMRLSQRLGWVKTDKRNAQKIERELMEIVPKEDWVDLTHLLIDHGRAICTARSPKCDQCVVEKLCPSSQLRQKLSG